MRRRLGKNSVGSRQLKAKSVTTGKIANNAVTGAKVANSSLTGADINLNALGTVPSATTAAQAGNANTVAGHAAACPGGTTADPRRLLRRLSNPAAAGVKEAADACAAKGGYLPGHARTLLGPRRAQPRHRQSAPIHQFTDTYYANTSGSRTTARSSSRHRTMTKQGAFDLNAEYICAYPLVR